MKQSHIVQALQVALVANVPVIIWGEPGAGKTATVNAVAQALDWPIETVLASLREPTDFAGLPVIMNGEMRLAAPDWAARLATQTDAICFFDEISTASPSTQRALLRVIHERVVGDLALGFGVRMIAAANPADIAAGGWDLAPPLANRFLHLDYQIDPTIVAAGMLGRWPDTQPLSIPANWESRIPHHQMIVSAFLSARPNLAHQRPNDRAGAGLGWPSPRSWESVCRVLAACSHTAIAEDARLGLIAGLVGDGTALEFLAYERDLDLPDPKKLLADPSSYQSPKRSDQVHAIIISVTDLVMRNLDAANWTKAMRVFAAVAAAGNVDIAAGGVRQLAALQPNGAEVPEELAAFGEVLAAAGILAKPKAPRSTTRSGAKSTKRPKTGSGAKGAAKQPTLAGVK